MYNRTQRTAEQFHIVEQVKKLEFALLQIDGVTQVSFDLSGFYDNMHQVIFLTKYDIPVTASNYYEQRRTLIHNVIATAKEHGLTRTEDHIEDYGEWLYFVMNHDASWIH